MVVQSGVNLFSKFRDIRSRPTAAAPQDLPNEFGGNLDDIFNPFNYQDNINNLIDRQQNSGGGNFRININNQTGQNLYANNTQVNRNAGGGFDISMIVRGLVNQELSRGSFDNQLSSRFDLSRRSLS